MGPILRARIAGQSGLVTRAQALGGGYTRDAIAWLLDTSRWVRIHPGIYQTIPGRDDWETRAVAALLHAGLGSALWGPSAGHAWGLVKHEPAQIHVVIPAHRRVRPVDGTVIRRSGTAADRVHPTAWPHRIVAEHTVWDIAQGDPFDRAVSLAAKAIDLDLATSDALSVALEQRPRQSHAALLREALADVADGAESTAEVRYVRDVERAHGLPTGVHQSPIQGRGWRDVEYAEWDLIIEVDGRLGHDGWKARQRDGRRDRKAATTGRTTVRVYWPDLVPTGCELAEDLAAILATKGWSGGAHPCGPGCPVSTTRIAS